jgi:hypothetical protein
MNYKSLVVKLLLGVISYATYVAYAQQDCSNFQGQMGCTSGQATNPPADWASRSFQTPLPHDPYYKDQYEGLGRIMCYNNIVYSSDLKSANIECLCRQHSSINKVQFNWNN